MIKSLKKNQVRYWHMKIIHVSEKREQGSVLKKIYTELVLIRKELQAIKISLEPKEIIYQPKTKVVRVDGITKRVPNESQALQELHHKVQGTHQQFLLN